ncbi:MAG: hypothetical protein M1837_006733 [Sclerophora amabilis]|nr:MAG: hypothetical protein M1837_006733 [Sclerophora amabilis]
MSSNGNNALKGKIISLPFPTERLASSALHALEVDKELSTLVQRSFSLASPADVTHAPDENASDGTGLEAQKVVLQTRYKATTNRMLRVAVNGFMESLGVVLGVMEELDVDVLDSQDSTQE